MDEGKHRTWAEARDEMLAADPELARAYEESRPAFLVAREVLRARRRLGLTQKELADRVGVTQSQVSRIERMDSTPSLTTVHRFATALGMQLDLRFVDPVTTNEDGTPSDAGTEILAGRAASLVQTLIDLGFIGKGPDSILTHAPDAGVQVMDLRGKLEGRGSLNPRVENGAGKAIKSGKSSGAKRCSR